MTHRELYQKATTWTAGHVAQDEANNFGWDTKASEYTINKVNEGQVKEGGRPIIPFSAAA